MSAFRQRVQRTKRMNFLAIPTFIKLHGLALCIRICRECRSAEHYYSAAISQHNNENVINKKQSAGERGRTRKKVGVLTWV